MSYATVSYSTQDGFPSVVICSRDRIYRVASPVIARVVVRLCRVFHRNRRVGLPAAGRELTFPVSCNRCGSAWDVVRPHGWADAFTPPPAASDPGGEP